MERYPSARPPNRGAPHHHPSQFPPQYQQPQPPQQQQQGVEAEAEADGEVNDGTGDLTIIMRIGFIVGGAVIAAVVSSLPAALRMGDEASFGRALGRWLVLSALGTPIMVAAVAVLRRARIGLKLAFGVNAIRFAMGLLWWAVIEMGLLAVFGAVLRKTTHQHSLAGVTFAIFAIVSGLIVGLFARRTTTILSRGGASLSRVGLIIAGIAAFLAVMLVGIRTSRADGIHTAAALVDGLAMLVTATIASSQLPLRIRPLAIAGVPVAVLLIMIGLTTLRFDNDLRKSLTDSAPMHMVVLNAFGHERESPNQNGDPAQPAPSVPSH